MKQKLGLSRINSSFSDIKQNKSNKQLELKIFTNLNRLKPVSKPIQNEDHEVNLIQPTNDPLSVFLIRPNKDIFNIACSNIYPQEQNKKQQSVVKTKLLMPNLDQIFQIPVFNYNLQSNQSKLISSVDFSSSDEQFSPRIQPIQEKKIYFSIFERFSRTDDLKLTKAQVHNIMITFLQVKITKSDKKLSSISTASLHNQKTHGALKIQTSNISRLQFELEMILKNDLLKYWFDLFLDKGKLNKKLLDDLKDRLRVVVDFNKQMEIIIKRKRY